MNRVLLTSGIGLAMAGLALAWFRWRARYWKREANSLQDVVKEQSTLQKINADVNARKQARDEKRKTDPDDFDPIDPWAGLR